MTAAQAARILGVDEQAPWEEVRSAYRLLIRSHHPDHAGDASSPQAVRIIEAYRVLDDARTNPAPPPPPPAAPSARPGRTDDRAQDGFDVSDDPQVFWRASRRPAPQGLAPPTHRIDSETLLLEAPADETFRWLVDAAHDVGEITYVDGSVPIMEVLCRFEGEPATSLLITLQGRSNGTEAFCTVESIEDRPAPPVAAVVDLLELALHRRNHPEP
jgi:hypothetical protein